MSKVQLKKLGRWMSEELGDTPPSLVTEERRAFLDEVEKDTRFFAPRVTMYAFAGVAAIAVITAILVVMLGNFEAEESTQDTQSQIASDKVEGHKVVTANTGEEIIEFDGGSKFVLSQGSSAKVIQNNAAEVALSLGYGSVQCSVNGNGYTQWKVLAGNYQVIVTGTKFIVQWTPEDNQFSVAVSEGAVHVKGESLNTHGIQLTAGENIQVDGSNVVITQDEDKKGTHISAGKIEADSDASEIQTGEKSSNNGKTRRSTHGKELSYEQLWRQSKSARYAGKHEKAYQLLTELRTRFPNRAYASQATFLLGRISLESKKSPGEAKKWFETYLKSSPKGALAEESMGRLIGICNRMNHSCAKQHASKYLSQYPHGVFAELAQSVIE